MNSEMLTLRPATNRDGEAVRTLVFSVLHEYGLKPDPDGVDADMLDLEASYIERGGSFHVLTDPGGVILGSVGLYPSHDGICELRKMYLVAEARGQGLGKRLLEHALAESKRLGFARIELETASVMKEAIGLYRRYGFQLDTSDRTGNRCNQAYFMELPMKESTIRP